MNQNPQPNRITTAAFSAKFAANSFQKRETYLGRYRGDVGEI